MYVHVFPQEKDKVMAEVVYREYYRKSNQGYRKVDGKH